MRDILARYGIMWGSETIYEYAALESAKNGGDIGPIAREVEKAIEAENFAEKERTLNPWFNDAQVAVIRSYMDGKFSSALLASERRPNVYFHDALLAYLVAACDSRFQDSHDKLCSILSAVNNPIPELPIRDPSEFAPAQPYIWEIQKRNTARLAIRCPFREKALDAFEEVAGDHDLRNCDMQEGWPDGSILFEFAGVPRSGKLFTALESVIERMGAGEKDYMLEIDAVDMRVPQFRGRLQSCASPHPRYEIGTDPETNPELKGEPGSVNPFRKLARALSANFDEAQIMRWAKEAVSGMRQKGPASK